MLFLEIRRNRKLAARRSPMFEKNRFAKVFMYCGIAFWADISCCLFPKGKSYSLFFWINFGIRLISSGYSFLSLSP